MDRYCCNCTEWRGIDADEFDKCHINKCGFVRFDNYCEKFEYKGENSLSVHLTQDDFEPKEVSFKR